MDDCWIRNQKNRKHGVLALTGCLPLQGALYLVIWKYYIGNHSDSKGTHTNAYLRMRPETGNRIGS